MVYLRQQLEKEVLNGRVAVTSSIFTTSLPAGTTGPSPSSPFDLLSKAIFWIKTSCIRSIMLRNASSTFWFCKADVSRKYRPSSSAKLLPSSSSTSLDCPRSDLLPTRTTTVSGLEKPLSSDNHFFMFWNVCRLVMS